MSIHGPGRCERGSHLPGRDRHREPARAVEGVQRRPPGALRGRERAPPRGGRVELRAATHACRDPTGRWLSARAGPSEGNGSAVIQHLGLLTARPWPAAFQTPNGRRPHSINSPHCEPPEGQPGQFRRSRTGALSAPAAGVQSLSPSHVDPIVPRQRYPPAFSSRFLFQYAVIRFEIAARSAGVFSRRLRAAGFFGDAVGEATAGSAFRRCRPTPAARARLLRVPRTALGCGFSAFSRALTPSRTVSSNAVNSARCSVMLSATAFSIFSAKSFILAAYALPARHVNSPVAAGGFAPLALHQMCSVPSTPAGNMRRNTNRTIPLGGRTGGGRAPRRESYRGSTLRFSDRRPTFLTRPGPRCARG